VAALPLLAYLPWVKPSGSCKMLGEGRKGGASSREEDVRWFFSPAAPPLTHAGWCARRGKQSPAAAVGFHREAKGKKGMGARVFPAAEDPYIRCDFDGLIVSNRFGDQRLWLAERRFGPFWPRWDSAAQPSAIGLRAHMGVRSRTRTKFCVLGRMFWRCIVAFRN
jgi:hypothetical protein